MDVSAIIGEELKAVEFVEDFLQLRFEAPLLVLYAWPHVLFPEFSVAYGEPEYRNALCAQIGERGEGGAGWCLVACREFAQQRQAGEGYDAAEEDSEEC